MKGEKIFVGTIMECTECMYVPHLEMEDYGVTVAYGCGHMEAEDRVYKEDAILVRTKNGLYIDVDVLNPLRAAYLCFESKNNVRRGDPYMFEGAHGTHKGELFVASDSIRPYMLAEPETDVSIMKLKKKHKKDNY